MSQIPIRDLRAPVAITILQKRGGQLVEIETMGGPGKCRSCGADVVFVETANGKRPPFNPVPMADTKGVLQPAGATHFATCPAAEEWKGKAKVASNG